MNRTALGIRKLSGRRRLWYFLAALFVCGIFCGVFTLKILPGAFLGELSALAEKQRGGTNFSGAFIDAFVSSLVCLVIMFFSGFSAIGQPVAMGALFCRGVAYGALSGVVYARYGMGGALPYALVAGAEATMAACALIPACRESVIFSREMFVSGFSSSADNNAPQKAKHYCVKYIIFTVIGAAFAALSAVFRMLTL